MVYRLERPLPPRGSTAWGAAQIYRLLDEEERAAAERAQLRAMGRLPTPEFGTVAGHSIIGDTAGYDGLPRVHLTSRRAYNGEPPQRSLESTMGNGPAPLTRVNPDLGRATGGRTAGGGRFGVPVPDPSLSHQPELQRISLTDRTGERTGNFEAEPPQNPQVAFAPLAIALEELLLLLGVAGAGIAAQDEIQRQQDQSPLWRGLDFSARDMLPPQRPEPPRDFDPEEARRILQLFGRPYVNIPPAIDLTPETFPIQEEWFPNTLTGPELDNPPFLPPWVERRGSEATRNLNAETAETTGLAASDVKSPAKHWRGARNSDKVELKELYLPNSSTKKSAGGNYIDIAFLHEGTARRLLIQTIDTKADGSPSMREHDNNVRVLRNMKSGDILVLVPKLKEGDILNKEALRAFLRPLIQDLGNFDPADDTRGSSGSDLWWHFRP